MLWCLDRAIRKSSTARCEKPLRRRVFAKHAVALSRRKVGIQYIIFVNITSHIFMTSRNQFEGFFYFNKTDDLF